MPTAVCGAGTMEGFGMAVDGVADNEERIYPPACAAASAKLLPTKAIVTFGKCLTAICAAWHRACAAAAALASGKSPIKRRTNHFSFEPSRLATV